LITVTEQEISVPYECIGDEVLLESYHAGKVAMESIITSLQGLEAEMHRRMRDRGATSIPSESWRCEIQTSAVYYDERLVPLLEILNEPDLATCYTPAHQETVDIPAKWHMTKVKALARRYGDQATAVVDGARGVGASRLLFKERHG